MTMIATKPQRPGDHHRRHFFAVIAMLFALAPLAMLASLGWTTHEPANQTTDRSSVPDANRRPAGWTTTNPASACRGCG